MRLHPDRGQHSGHVVEPVHLVGGSGQPHRPAAVPSGVHAGLFGDLFIEVGRITVNLGGVKVADEVGDKAGGMPGGSGSEFVLFDQEGVGPTFMGEKIEKPHPHGPSADDRYPDLFTHLVLRIRIGEIDYPGHGSKSVSKLLKPLGCRTLSS